MTQQVYADGGWVVGLVFIILLIIPIAIIVRAFLRKRKEWSDKSPDDHKPEPASGIDTKPAKSPDKKDSKHGDKHGHGESKLPQLLGAGIAIVIVLGFAIWMVTGGWYTVFGPPVGSRPQTQASSHWRAIVPTTVKNEPTAAELEANARKERERIEAEEYKVTVKYGETPAWIHKPGGSYQTHYAVVDNKVIGMQCSPTADKPDDNALGPDQFVCSDDVTTNWVRFFAMLPDETVTIRYYFRKFNRAHPVTS